MNNEDKCTNDDEFQLTSYDEKRIMIYDDGEPNVKGEMRECPFCGGWDDVHLCKTKDAGYFVTCFCGAEGDPAANRRVAIRSWNTRNPSIQKLAQHLYETYRRAANCQMLSGDTLPTWEEIAGDNQLYWSEWVAWEHVAAAVYSAKWDLVFVKPAPEPKSTTNAKSETDVKAV